MHLGQICSINGNRYVVTSVAYASEATPNEAIALVELKEGQDEYSVGRTIGSAPIDIERWVRSWREVSGWEVLSEIKH